MNSPNDVNGIEASNIREVQVYRYGLYREPHWIRGQSVAERYRYDLAN
jgi:hypothetical protein